MGTALAVHKNPRGIGGDSEMIAQVQKRIMNMIPGAAEAPAPVVWAVAQIATALDLNPLIGEVYIAKIKGVWGPIIATTGFEALARRIAKFDYRYTQMTPDELKAHRGMDYDPDDVGVKITLRRWDEMAEAKRYGIDYWPIETYGIWRKKGQGGAPDNIHNTWTKIQMAEYRALRTALKRGFSLGHAETVEKEFGAFGDEFDIEVAATLQERIEGMDRDASPVAGNGRHADDELLFASERRAPVVSAPADEDDYTDYQDALSAHIPAQPERELVTMLNAAIYGYFGADADAHIAEIEAKKKKAMADMSDTELKGWQAWIEQQADKQPA